MTLVSKTILTNKSIKMKFRKKPVVIEAIQWDGTYKGMVEINIYFKNIVTASACYHQANNTVSDWRIITLEGGHIVSKGDFVIRGIAGEYYPCKPDIFEKTYEKVEESNVSSQEPDAEQMKTDKGVVLAHYYQVEPDSHYWTSLEMLLNYLKQVEIFTGYRSYLIKGIENTIKNGFRLINTPQTTQEPDATASKEIGEPLVQNKSNQ
jgi:hypothetical protein